MTNNTTKNLLFPGDKGWLATVDKEFDKYLTIWIRDYKRGELTAEDVINVTEKIAQLRNDDDLINVVKQRMGLL